jgi:hypothetical protein
MDAIKGNGSDVKLKHIALNQYTLKEGEPWKMRVKFKVHNEIVLGLKLCFACKKSLLPTIKSEMFVGNYPPTKTPHTVDLDEQVTPSGFFQRGVYNGKARFLDYDGLVHMQYGFRFEISNQW